MATAQSDSAQQDLGATTYAHPVSPADRIASIDILRGISLFGVMAINVVTEFRVSIFEQFLSDGIDGSWLDRWLHATLMFAIDLKAFALFSLLFGVGLAIQYDHLPALRRTTLLVRRLAFLMFVGALHLVLVWNGDILLEYAVAGLVVLMILSGPSWMATVVGAALLIVFIAGPFLPPTATMPSRGWMAETIAEATRIYGSGGYLEILSFRIRELSGLLPLHLFILPRTIALMLIGAAAWRAGFFRTRSSASGWLPLVAMVGLLCGGTLTSIHANASLGMGWRGELSLERLATVLLAFGYGAAIVWASDKTRARALLAWAAPVGRMALSNYLIQSVVFAWLFYGYGLGLFGKLGVASALAIGTAVYAGQVMFSAKWLQRYRFGPFEWLWRSAMYATWQPLRITAR